MAALIQHQKHAVFGKIDLSGFFNNVSRHRITRALKKVGYAFRDAQDFAIASTVLVSRKPRKFALPYGFVQSPLLASIALDKSALGASLKCMNAGAIAVSVYVDDIIVSSDSDAEIADALTALRSAADQSNFPINEEKSSGPYRILSAFNIELRNDFMVIENDRYQEMCRTILKAQAGPVSEGILGYVRSVSPNQAERMERAFPRIFPRHAE